MLMHFIIILYVMAVFGVKSQNEKIKLQCRICKEMFKYEFDYDKLIQNQNKFDSECLENLAKEISMQFFFKGGEIQFDSLIPSDIDFGKCKLDNSNDRCINLKFKLCESILNFEKNECSGITRKTEDSKNFIKIDNTSTNINSIPLRQNPPKSANDFSNISLIQMTPEYVTQNFDSTPKSHWNPPKPVLLENFENSMGDQLKDISFLTSEIAKYENKLKIMKQELANKLEIAQSNYNVIQKTLNEISKMPDMTDIINSPSKFTEDDWDETSKPKFLNN